MGGYQKMRSGVITNSSAFARLAWLIMTCALGLALAACNLPNPGGAIPIQPTNDALPQAWIDAPREGQSLSGGPYEVIFHGSGARGIERGELSVDSMVIATPVNPNSGSTQANFRTLWTPSRPGRAVLQARVKDSAGRWSAYAEVTVMVGAPVTATATVTLPPTRTSIATVLPTRAASSTLTATPLPSITPSATPHGALGYRVQAWPAVFFSGGCTPDHVDFSVQVEPYRDVVALYMLVRLEEPSSGSRTPWSTPLSMGKKANNLYTYSLPFSRIPGDEGLFPSATLLVQFVAMDGNYDVISRSDFFTTVTLARCGEKPAGTALPAPGRQVVTITPLNITDK